MSKTIDLIAAMRENYALVMDSDKNPLMILPPAQRFQTMIYLCLMWTTIFCAIFGMWFWYGQIIAFHLLVVGVAVTGMTFESAWRTQRLPNSLGRRCSMQYKSDFNANLQE
jgi:hypothetical protein